MDYKAILEQLYAAYQTGDADTVLSLMNQNVTFVSHGPKGLPWSGVHKGHEGAIRFMTAILNNLSEYDDYSILQISVDGDTAFLRGQSSGTVPKTGKSFLSPFVHYFQFENGKVSLFQEYYDTAAQLSAMTPD